MSAQPDDLITVRVACVVARVTRMTVWVWIRKGWLRVWVRGEREGMVSAGELKKLAGERALMPMTGKRGRR